MPAKSGIVCKLPVAILDTGRHTRRIAGNQEKYEQKKPESR
jgi:hypothetical protein